MSSLLHCFPRGMMSLIFIQSRLHADSGIRRFAPSHPELCTPISAKICVAPSYSEPLAIPCYGFANDFSSISSYSTQVSTSSKFSRSVQVSHSCTSFSLFANNTSRSLLLHTSIPHLQASCSVHQSLIFYMSSFPQYSCVAFLGFQPYKSQAIQSQRAPCGLSNNLSL